MSDKQKDGRPFAQRHPKWNILIGLILLLVLLAVGVFAIYFSIKYVGIGISRFVKWISELASKLDAVVIVAFITGGVSIIGVVLNSIVSKRIDYKKSKRDYLAQKREKPYGEFVDMIYKIQQNSKKTISYTEAQMLDDLSRFSKQITLWGSPRVVNGWIKFRENGSKPDVGTENLFLMEKIMNDMRKDLGLKKVKKGNLLGFFVNDIKAEMKRGKS